MLASTIPLAGVTVVQAQSLDAGSTPLNLDLSSTDRTYAHNADLDVSILVGGSSSIVKPGKLLTPAEQIAVNQVMATGRQSILLSSHGNAIGGNIHLATFGPVGIANLQVPAGVTAILNAADMANLNLSGELANSGSIFAVSTNPSISSARILAENIVNNGTGSISSVLPSEALPGITGAISKVNLELHARDSILNSGVITSSGDLHISAGQQVSNIRSTREPMVSSVNDVNVTSGSIKNQGIIESFKGSINISAPEVQSLIVNNDQGQIRALEGAINFGNSPDGQQKDLHIAGGNLTAQQVNCMAGIGKVHLDVGGLVGTLNTVGTYAYVNVSTPELILGQTKIGGDPTFINGAIGGDIFISGNIQVNEKLSIIASRDIKTGPNVSLIQARDAAGQGFDIHLVAGADVTGSTYTSEITGTPPLSGNSVSAVLLGGSASGGNVDFSQSSSISINANSTCSDCDGGNVVIAAYAGGGNSGKIILASDNSTSQITAGGNGLGSNGNVSLIAGATSGTSIVSGKISARGGDDSTGVISITTAQPTFSNGSELAFDNTGTITSGNTIVPSPIVENASVNLTRSLDAGEQVTVTAGHNVKTLTGVTSTIPLHDNAFPKAIAFTPSGDFAYVTTYGTHRVSVIRTSDNTEVRSIDVGNEPYGIVINPDGTYAYVTSRVANSVYVIRLSDNTVVQTIPVGASPHGIAIDPSGSSVYVVNANGNSVSVIRTSDNTVTSTIGVGVDPVGIAIDPSGTFAYITNYNPNVTGFVKVLRLSDYVVVATVPVGHMPVGITPSPDGSFVYVANVQSNTVSVIRTSDNTVVENIQVGAGGPYGVAVSALGTTGFATNYDCNCVRVIRLSDNVVVSTVEVGNHPRGGIAVSPLGSDVYVSNFGSGDVSVISTPILSAGKVDLTAVNGHVEVSTNAERLSVSAGSHATIDEHDDLVFEQSSINGDLSLTAGGAIATEGQVSAQDMLLKSTSQSGDITVGGDLTVQGALNVETLGGMGHFMQTAGEISVGGILILDVAEIGDHASHINIQSANSLSFDVPIVGESVILKTAGLSTAGIQVNSISAGSLLSIDSSGAVNTAGDVSVSNGDYHASAAGSISTHGEVVAENIFWEASGVAGSIYVGHYVSASGAVSLAAHGTGNISGPALVSATQLHLATDSGQSIVNSRADSLGFNTSGNVTVIEFDGLNLLPSSSDDGSLSVVAGGEIVVGTDTGDVIHAARGISLTTSGAFAISGPGQLSSGSRLTISNGSGPVNVKTDVQSIMLHGSGDVSVEEKSELILDSSTISTGRVRINVLSGALQIGSLSSDVFTAGGGIDLTIDSGELHGAGWLRTNGEVSIQSQSGAVAINTDVNSLHLSINGNATINQPEHNLTLLDSDLGAGNLHITLGATNDLTVGTNSSEAISASQIRIESIGSGNIGGDAVLRASGAIVVKAQEGTIDLVLDTSTPIDFSSSGNVNLTAKSSLDGSVVSPDGDLVINAGTGRVLLNTHVQGFAATSIGEICVIDQDDLVVGDSSGPVLIFAASQLSIHGDLQATESVNFIGNALNVDNKTITAPFIQMNGEDLHFSGKGTFDGNSILLASRATTNLTFTSDSEYVFTGNAKLTALGQTVYVETNANINGLGELKINAASLNAVGQIVGNPLVMEALSGAGTITNPSGDILLPSNLIFFGSDLTIIASGSVLATSKVTSINLSNKSGDGGSLSIIAGADFIQTHGTVSEPGVPIPSTGSFYLTGPSSSGGSIHLPKVSINTSSTLPGGNAGNVTLVAFAGAADAGTISIGPTNASANTTKGGQSPVSFTVEGAAGQVKMIAQGGIQSGPINARGALGGDVQLLGLAPQLGGTLFYVNGVHDHQSGIFWTESPTIENGAAIEVAGSIDTTGTRGYGGDVVIRADSQIKITDGIFTSGLTAGSSTLTRASGDVEVTSLTSRISIGTRGVSTNALPSSLSNAGNAGTISLFGANVQSGSLQSKGGNNLGSGNGGDGGTLLISTVPITVGSAELFFGQVSINGFIDSRGGSASNATTSTGGEGGDITVNSGSIAVKLSTGGASVVASGGAAGTTGTGGLIYVRTHATQPMSSNLDLTSGIRNVVALPGGMLTVGLPNPVNGFSGKLVTNGITVDKSVNGTGRILEQNSIVTPGIELIVNGDLQQINTNVGVKSIGPANSAGVRTRVTPAEALALVEVTRQGIPASNGINLSFTGRATGGTSTVSDLDLNSITFSSFKLPANVGLYIEGTRPVLNLPSTSLLSGTIDFFSGGTLYVNLAKGNHVVQPSGSINSSGNLFLSIGGASFTNNGSISSGGDIILGRPSPAPVSVIGGLNSSTVASRLVIGRSVDDGMNFTFKANGIQLSEVPLVFDNVPVPTIYADNARAHSANVHQLPTVNLSFALVALSGVDSVPLMGWVGGNIEADSITIKGVNHVFNGAKFSSGILIGSSSQFAASKAITISSTDIVVVEDYVNITAGVLKPTSPDWDSPNLLDSKDVLVNGSLRISSTGLNGISIGSGTQLTNNGSYFNISANPGAIVIGDDNTFRSMGGNVVFLAKDVVLAGKGNALQAKGTTLSGGGIEVGSGVIAGTISSAFLKAPGTQPPAEVLGSNVTIINNGGVVWINPVAGPIGTGDGSNSTLTLNGGAIVFDVKGENSFIRFDRASFETKSAKPIFNTSLIETDLLIETADDVWEEENF